MSGATRRTVLAERAARAGGVVAREAFREEVAVETKTDVTDLVTAVDRDAQRQVVATVRQEFPDDVFVCEEEPMGGEAESVRLRETVPDGEAAWVVDPIDGTANFVRGHRFWATSVAAVVDGRPVGVASYLPAMDDIYTAGQDGAMCNDATIGVSDRADPETVAVGLPGRWPRSERGRLADLFRAIVERFGDARRLGSMQGALALVAGGALDAVCVPDRQAPWDTVAGVHLVRRAGGTVTDLAGDRWTHESRGLVASNGAVHDAIREAVRGVTNVEAAD